jgi:DNA mismatch endonuclease (patch repair protein)
MDKVSPATRSAVMARVKGRDTGPEKRLRSLLFRQGFRFRLHKADLPGTPDIVLPRYRTAVFVHGCFWHRHAGCRRASTPASNVAYWERKFRRTVERDAAVAAALEALGWRVVVVWECELSTLEKDCRVLTDNIRQGIGKP